MRELEMMGRTRRDNTFFLPTLNLSNDKASFFFMILNFKHVTRTFRPIHTLCITLFAFQPSLMCTTLRPNL